VVRHFLRSAGPETRFCLCPACRKGSGKQRQIIFYTQKSLFCFKFLQIFKKFVQLIGFFEREAAAARVVKLEVIGLTLE